MTQKIRARYVGGKLELLDAVDLPEGALVNVTVEEALPQYASADPLLASAGGWVGLVDFEEFLRDMYANRKRSSPEITF